MRAFIVRPFGTRNGIDFDRVQETLIQPALIHQNIDGGTTGLIVEAGNIREDMFQQLLVADVVIADISIHNANVFYELGIRHALQPRHTLMIRARTEDRMNEVPFDLRTDRYLQYDPADLAASVPALIRSLAETRISHRQDSPVFLLLPNLRAQDRSHFLTVPLEFAEEVQRAARGNQHGKLALLGMEAGGQTWESEGLRLVGREQFRCETWQAAQVTWEAVRVLDGFDVEANLALGTIHQKLKDAESSNQALQRVINGECASQSQRAEALALQARNIKTRWRQSWESVEDLSQRQRRALRTPGLLDAYEKYYEAYKLDLNHFYSGLNALSLLTIGMALADALPAVFSAPYTTDEKAAAAKQEYEAERRKLAAAVELSIQAARRQSEVSSIANGWLDSSTADLCFLTSNRPGQVEFLYERVLAEARSFDVESMRSQILLFKDLAILMENVEAALGVFPPVRVLEGKQVLDRVVLFTGHMIDPPGRTPPRFPPSCEGRAYEAIRRALESEKARAQGGALVALAGGACGGDLLFHEVCEELGIPSELYLPLPPNVYRTESVRPAGPDWVTRFDRLLNRLDNPPVLARADDLPSWLASKQTYSPWQRANLWLFNEALAKTGRNLQIVALWDGEPGDGPGGTEHLFRIAKEHGAGIEHLNTTVLFGGSCDDITCHSSG